MGMGMMMKSLMGKIGIGKMNDRRGQINIFREIGFYGYNTPSPFIKIILPNDTRDQSFDNGALTFTLLSVARTCFVHALFHHFTMKAIGNVRKTRPSYHGILKDLNFMSPGFRNKQGNDNRESNNMK
jgi:hypothetical protein